MGIAGKLSVTGYSLKIHNHGSFLGNSTRKLPLSLKKVDLMKFLETLLNGFSAGSTYAMIALGYTMVYGIVKMLNFAHGDVIMVGGYTLYVTACMLGINPLVSLLLAVICCAVLRPPSPS